jgi:hypothetical protein
MVEHVEHHSVNRAICAGPLREVCLLEVVPVHVVPTEKIYHEALHALSTPQEERKLMHDV